MMSQEGAPLRDFAVVCRRSSGSRWIGNAWFLLARRCERARDSQIYKHTATSKVKRNVAGSRLATLGVGNTLFPGYLKGQWVSRAMLLLWLWPFHCGVVCARRLHFDSRVNGSPEDPFVDLVCSYRGLLELSPSLSHTASLNSSSVNVVLGPRSANR